MEFLSTLLERPKTERPFMILGVGLPHENAQVPKLEKKTLEQVFKFYN